MNRSFIQKKNIFFGLLFKGTGIGLNLLLIPLLISYLGKVEYGVWITLFSVVNWIFVFDIGIGTGLRNKLTNALSVNDLDTANSLVSTSYVLITIFGILIFLLGLVFIFTIDFQDLINYDGRKETYLKLFFFLTLFFTAINFVLSLYKKLFLAIHKSFLIELTNTIFLIFYFIAVFIFILKDYEESLISLVIIFGVINIIVSFFATALFFRISKNIQIGFKYYSKKMVKPLFKLGGNFFLINLSLLILLLTDNIIISKFLNPSHVTDYSVVQRIFQFLIMTFSIIIASSWSLYSQAIIKEDFKWIRQNIKKMHFFLILLIAVGFLFCLFVKDILEIWLGANVIDLPKGLAEANFAYFILFSYANVYMYFINATGRIKLQMYLYLFGALINIPLSIYLIRIFGSSTGVIISTILCILPLVIVMPVQAIRILSEFEGNVINK